VRAEVKKGALSAGHARALLAHPDPEKGALQVVARGLSVRQTEELAKPKTEGASAHALSKAKDPETEALERDLSQHLGLKVDITFDGKGGTIRLSYRTLDQLDGIVTLLNR